MTSTKSGVLSREEKALLVTGVGSTLDVLYGPENPTDELGAKRARGRVTTLKAVLWDACSMWVDLVFDDLRILEAAHINGPDEHELFSARDFLPDVMAEQYSVVFLRRFLVSTAAVTERFVGVWRPPANLAEDLAVHLILGQAEVLIDTYEYKVPTNWRHDLGNLLQTQTGVDALYDPRWPHLTDATTIQPVPVSMNDWFTRYAATTGAAAYADPDTWPDSST